MGMLFNTEGTIRILNMLNAAFKGKKFHALQNSAGVVNLINTLRNLPAGTTYAVAQQLGIDDYDNTVSNNWQTWLGYLDGRQQTTNGNTNYCSYFVGNAIANALADGANCVGVEFYAVPDTGVRVSIQDLPIGNRPNPYVKVITAFTETVDHRHPH